jgi:DNA adenine methylase
MQYLGGKAYLAKYISPIINKYLDYSDTFYSPFCGAINVECRLKFPKMYLSDINYYLIMLYRYMQHGWLPPENVSEEEYNYIKTHRNEHPGLSGFVGHACAFGGLFFAGYARGSYNYAKVGYSSILKKFVPLIDANFDHKDYRELFPINSVVYCDPPYQDASKDNRYPSIDSDEFFQVMRDWSKNNLVVISEYRAPNDFVSIFCKKKSVCVNSAERISEEVTENLFIHESNMYLVKP